MMRRGRGGGARGGKFGMQDNAKRLTIKENEKLNNHNLNNDKSIIPPSSKIDSKNVSRNISKNMEKSNPFDLKVQRNKFQIMGKDVTGTTGAPAISRQRGIQIRKKTLLKEWKNRSNLNVFVDKRFGKKNKNMTEEERAMGRFTAAIKLKKRHEKFNLMNDDSSKNDFDNLTHLGQSIDKDGNGNGNHDQMDYYDDHDDWEDNSPLDALDHFGGFENERIKDTDEAIEEGFEGESQGEEGFEEGEEYQKKSRKEVMKEVMEKSKFYRLERQKQNEDNEQMVKEIDEAFSNLKDVLPQSLKEKKLKEEQEDFIKDEMKLELNSNNFQMPPSSSLSSSLSFPSLSKTAIKDDFDLSLKSLFFDKRVVPTDKRKTLEEVQRERDSKEMESLARMHESIMNESVKLNEKKTENFKDDPQDWKREKETKSQSGEKVERKNKGNPRIIIKIKQLLKDFTVNTDNLDLLQRIYLEFVNQIAPNSSIIEFGIVARSKISKTIKKIENRISDKKKIYFPNWSILSLFHLIGRIFSTSDWHHLIVSPAKLLMSFYLERACISRPCHLMAALFICQTFLEYEKRSKRVSFELAKFLLLLLNEFNGMGMDGKKRISLVDNISLSSPSIDKKNLLDSLNDSSVNLRPNHFNRKTFKNDDFVLFDVQEMTIKILLQAANLYSSNEAFVELFTPHRNALTRLSINLDEFNGLFDTCFANRKYLTIKKKPASISTLIPDLDIDRKRNHQTRLKDKHERLQVSLKRETKAAKRELQKDNAFLADVQREERVKRDKNYNSMIKNIMGTIGNDSTAGFQRKKR